MKKIKTLDELKVGDKVGLAPSMDYYFEVTVSDVIGPTVHFLGREMYFIKSNKVHQKYFIEFQETYEIASSPLAKVLREED